MRALQVQRLDRIKRFECLSVYTITFESKDVTFSFKK